MNATAPDAANTDACRTGRTDRDEVLANEDSPQIIIQRTRWPWLEWIAGLFLFLATAAVVVWQNSRLAVLWDLSYVLENSYRITLGQVPYRDFPFVHAPLTFLIQAAMIKLLGRVVWHHAAYCAISGGVATILTWRILLRVLRDNVAHARLLAFILSAPLILLGVYSIFPHPFYDPDCTVTILFSIFLFQKLETKECSPWRALLVGMTLVIPLFVKQNTGLAFLLSTGVALLTLIVVALWRKQSSRRYAFVLAGATLGLLCALLLIHFTTSLGNYWRWTIKFAAARRTPARADMIETYRDWKLYLWLIVFGAGAILFRFNRRSGSPVPSGRNRGLSILAPLLMSAPFVWPAIYLLVSHDADDRADQLLGVWPLLLIISFFVAILNIKRRGSLSLWLPFVLLVTIHGAFMSQQLWGSTYGIWPLFVILLASAIASLASYSLDTGRAPQTERRTSPPAKRFESFRGESALAFCLLVSASLLISGGFYVWSNERLDYANLTEGNLVRSSSPQLKGLTTRGDWIPDFEELVRYADQNIPRDDGVMLLPGEDLFFYTTGRQPQFPIVFFDRTTNPYSPEEIIQLCRERNIRWVIVKQELQLEEEPIENRDRLMELIEKDYEQVESLGNYDIYRRSEGEREEDDRDGK